MQRVKLTFNIAEVKQDLLESKNLPKFSEKILPVDSMLFEALLLTRNDI